MRIKFRITALILTLFLIILSVSACDIKKNNDDSGDNKDTSENAANTNNTADTNDGGDVDNSETGITVMTQEYIVDNIAEILMISYNGQQPVFEEYNWKNPEIELLNNSIKGELNDMYNDFMIDPNYSWIEIKSYPFTSEDYLQIVSTYVIYPTYGTDGDMVSYNFDKKANKYIMLDEAMSDLGLTEEIITQNVKDLYVSEYPGDYIEKVETAGFLIRDGMDGPYTLFLLEVTIANPGAGSWKNFYAYEPDFNQFYPMSSYCLFDPYDMDEMDPPLKYAQSEDVETELTFADLDGFEFEFSSGAGGWATIVVIQPDGTFAGNYHDSELGSMGDDYPDGTVYICEFSGKFTELTQVGYCEYSMKLESLTQEGIFEEEEIIDGVKYITSYPYGFDDAEEFRLYLPGKAANEIPELNNWAAYGIDPEIEYIDFYGLYNINGQQGFVYRGAVG